tara:strand:- start:2703 stop:2888 length:186 start_codon:yes stop_codon:yes gene_type:complete
MHGMKKPARFPGRAFLPADGVSDHCLERWPSISDATLQEAKFQETKLKDARLKQRSTAQTH